MTKDERELYPCVGICQADPDSGICLGCGRPPLATPEDSAKEADEQVTEDKFYSPDRGRAASTSRTQ